MPVDLPLFYRRSSARDVSRPALDSANGALDHSGPDSVEGCLLRKTRLRALPTVLVEEAQRLVEHMDLVLPRQPSPVVAFTSAGRREGVSTVACTVTAALASRQRGRVLLVDANAGSPLLLDSPRAGLADVLTGMSRRNDAIQPIAGTEISVIGWGDAAGDVSGCVDDRGVAAALDVFRSEFSYVIVDMAPPSAAPFVIRLAAAASAVALVVEAHRTSREQLKHTADTLRDAGAPFLGVVFNRRRPGWP